jgi:hypothetical protein
MGSVVREIHEERSVAVGFDGSHGFAGQVVGHVEIGGEARLVVLAYRESQKIPDKLVDGIEVLLRAHDVGVVGVSKHRSARIEPQ